MRPLLVPLLLVPLLAAGCFEDARPAALAPEPGAPAPVPVTFTEPVKLNAAGRGFEPSLEVDAHGHVYVTAHKSNPTHDGARLASWLWHSRDHGTTWEEMPSPLQQHDKLFAFEGDLALDAKGRLYFVDTYLADNAISRWSLGPDGPSWDFTSPFHGTTGLDDRPWLAAHGDGVVYYLANNVAQIPAPADLGGDASRIWFHRSTDGGRTWTPGDGFEGAQWCTMDASRLDDATLVAGCTVGRRAVVHRSADRGDTWERVEVGEYEKSPGAFYPATAMDLGGRAYHAWIDGHLVAGRLHVARDAGEGTWVTEDVTPLNGTFAMLWASGGAPGTLALTFYAAEVEKPDAQTEWHAYLLLGTGLDGAAPAWNLTRIDPEPVAKGNLPPIDFFQNAVGPDGAVHVAYERQTPNPLGRYGDILYVRQVSGPNVAPRPADAPAAAEGS